MRDHKYRHLTNREMASVRLWTATSLLVGVGSLFLPNNGSLDHTALILTATTFGTGALMAGGPAGMRAILGCCAVGAIIALMVSLT